MSETLEKMKAAVEQLNESKEGQDVKDAIDKIGAKDLKPIFQLQKALQSISLSLVMCMALETLSRFTLMEHQMLVGLSPRSQRLKTKYSNSAPSWDSAPWTEAVS